MGRRIDVEQLVDAAGVAQMLGLTHRNSVPTYLKRYQDFPRPLVETAAGKCRLWSRAEVARWLARRRKAGKVRVSR